MDVFVNDLGHLNSIYCSQNSHVWVIPSTNRVDLNIDSLDTYGTILSHGNIQVAGIGGVGASDFVVRNDTTGKADLWVGDLNATGDLDITGDVTADDLVANDTLRVGADANVAYLERSGRLMVAPYGITGGFSTSTSTNDVTKYLSKGEIIHTNTYSPPSLSFGQYYVYLPEQPSDGEEHTIVRTANSIEWLFFEVRAQNSLQIRKGASLYTNYNMYGNPGVNICQLTLKYSANTAEWIITSQFSF